MFSVYSPRVRMGLRLYKVCNLLPLEFDPGALPYRLRLAKHVDFRAANHNLRGGFPLWTTATRLGFSYRLLWCC